VARTAKERRKIRTNAHTGERKIPPVAAPVPRKPPGSGLVALIEDLNVDLLPPFYN
jgi:hypothetical protein